MPLIPHYEKKFINLPRKEGELQETAEVVDITYYDSNNKPSACKSCIQKKNKDLKYIMNLKRTGSAYCADCAKEYHESNENSQKDNNVL